jgi:hypothetical protein
MNLLKGQDQMKKVLLTILAVIVAVGLLAGAGFAGYRIGYRQGALTANTNNSNKTPFMHGFVHPNMPMQNFGRDFNRGMEPGGFGMRGGMMGLGLFGLLAVVGRILFWALVIWFVYWLFTRSGWQLTRKTQPVTTAQKVEAAPIETPTPEEKGS